MNTYLAKSKDSRNPQTLEAHSKAVATVSKYVADGILHLSPELCYKAYLTGLLHDIGKATEDNQNFFLNGSSEDFDGALHHEISWAILILPHGRVESSRCWEMMRRLLFLPHGRVERIAWIGSKLLILVLP